MNNAGLQGKPMPNNPVLVKSQNFAVRITRAHQYLVKVKDERRISDQLYRSGTSISANISEAQYAQTKADFITKMHIALKEANESRNWIEILHRTGFFDDAVFISIHNDIAEIIKLLTSILNTAKKNSEK